MARKFILGLGIASSCLGVVLGGAAFAGFGKREL